MITSQAGESELEPKLTVSFAAPRGSTTPFSPKSQLRTFEAARTFACDAGLKSHLKALGASFRTRCYTCSTEEGVPLRCPTGWRTPLAPSSAWVAVLEALTATWGLTVCSATPTTTATPATPSTLPTCRSVSALVTCFACYAHVHGCARWPLRAEDVRKLLLAVM